MKEESVTKIRLTETQLKLVETLITENYKFIDEFQVLSNKIKERVNRIYQQIISISVSEVVKNDFNLDGLYKNISDLESSLSDKYYKLAQNIQSLSDDEYDKIGTELDNKLENIYRPLEKKIDACLEIIEHLKEIKTYYIEYNISDSFTDVNNIEIS